MGVEGGMMRGVSNVMPSGSCRGFRGVYLAPFRDHLAICCVALATIDGSQAFQRLEHRAHPAGVALATLETPQASLTRRDHLCVVPRPSLERLGYRRSVANATKKARRSLHGLNTITGTMTLE